MMCGGLRPADINDQHVIQAFRNAVEKHNASSNETLEFVSVVSATQQVVRGMMLRGTIQCRCDGQNQNYSVDVWVKPGNEPIEVQKFERA